MKKLLIILALGLGVLTADAQLTGEERADSLQKVLESMQTDSDLQSMYNKTWGKGRFMRIGYVWTQSADDNNPVEKGKFGISLTKGTTYYFPKTPIAKMLKIGIDAVWFDVQVTKYNSGYSNLNWTSEIEPSVSSYFGGDDDDDDEGSGLFGDINLNLGRWGIGFGMGVGPNVSIAPFALTGSKIMQPLRVSVYFHYAPTVQMYMKSQDGDIEISTAFSNMMNLGANLTYRKIAIGYEARWGKGKFKPLDFGSMIMGDESLGTEKYTRRFANNRLYIQFIF